MVFTAAIFIVDHKSVNAVEGGIMNSISLNSPEENTKLLKGMIEKGDYDLVTIEKLLDHGANPNAKTQRDTLFVDVIQSNAPIAAVKLFVKKGANLAYKDHYKQDLFYLAAMGTKNPDIVDFLVEKGFKCHELKNNMSANHLLVAINYNESLAVIRAFAKVCPINAKNHLGENALFYALNRDPRGPTDVMAELIKMGLDVNEKNGVGQTLLNKAVSWKFSLEMINLLIKSGAKVKATNEDGQNALHYIYCIEDINIAKTLIKAGVNVNAKRKINNETPLYNAIFLDAPKENVELLLKSGARVDVRYGRLNTILHVTIDSNRDDDIFQMLVNAGADVNAQNGLGETPLMTAILERRKDNKINILLASKKIKLEIKGEYGDTALTLAASAGADLEHVIKPLVKRGAKVNAINDFGWSVLIRAVHGNCPLETFKFLVENGADVNIKSKKGETALSETKKGYGDRKAIIDYLISVGAK